MRMQFPSELKVAVFEVTRAMTGLVVGDRILVRPTPNGSTYELYRRLRAEDVEHLLTPATVFLNATEPDAVFGEAARLFARGPSLRQEQPRLVK
jgi:hypothetical protein